MPFTQGNRSDSSVGLRRVFFWCLRCEPSAPPPPNARQIFDVENCIHFRILDSSAWIAQLGSICITCKAYNCDRSHTIERDFGPPVVRQMDTAGASVVSVDVARDASMSSRFIRDSHAACHDCSIKAFSIEQSLDTQPQLLNKLQLKLN